MTISEIVLDNFLTSEVFSHYGIDFCCGGYQTLAEAIQSKNISSKEIIEALIHVQKSNVGSLSFNEWSLELLLDYVTKYHHPKIRKKGPQIIELLKKVSQVHGEAYPELIEVNRLFNQSFSDLLNHLMKEDTILYPYIYQLVNVQLANNDEVPCFGSVEGPISVMVHEHEQEGERFSQISHLTQGYKAPSDACQSYQLLMQLLAQFERDLHEHIYLENHLIFPSAIQVEKESQS